MQTFRKLQISSRNKWNNNIEINKHVYPSNIYIATCYVVPPSLLLHMPIYYKENTCKGNEDSSGEVVDKNMFISTSPR